MTKPFQNTNTELRVRVRVIDMSTRANQLLSNDQSMLPSTILVPKQSQPMVMAYRIYCGMKTITNDRSDDINQNLPNEQPVRTMAKIFNLWSVHKNFATFWNREIE